MGLTWLQLPKAAQRIVGALGLAVALAWAIWLAAGVLPQRRRMASGTDVLQSQPVFINLPPESVASVEVLEGSEAMTLTQTAQGWRMLSPVDGEINTPAAAAWVRTVCAWTSAGSYPGDPAADSVRLSLGLAPGILYRLRSRKGAVQEITVGHRAPDGTHWLAHKSQENTVRLISAPEMETVAGAVVRLRGRRVLARSLHDAIVLGLQTEAGVQVVEQEGTGTEGVWTVTQPAWGPAPQESVQVLLSLLSRWEYTEPQSATVWGRADLARYGLMPPAARLWMQFKANRRTVTVQLGAPVGTDGAVYAKVSDDTRVLRIEPAAFDRIAQQFAKLQNRRLLPGFDQLQRFELQDRVRRLEFQRRNQQWIVTRYARQHPEAAGRVVFLDSGEWFAPGLAQAEFIGWLTDRHPLASVYRHAQPYFQFTGYDEQGRVTVAWTVLKNPRQPETLFVERREDSRVFVVAAEVFNAVDLR